MIDMRSWLEGQVGLAVTKGVDLCRVDLTVPLGHMAFRAERPLRGQAEP